MSTIKVDSIKSSDGNTDLLTLSSGSVSGVNLGRRNLIINGAMQVAQRGTSFTTSVLQSTTYTVDRWAYYNDVVSKRTIEQSSTAPSGFNNSIKVTVIATDTTGPQQMLRCYLEGQNLTSLDWASGSGNAATLSFWVRSSVTGQHGGSIQDSIGSYSYPFAYTISSADTWEYKTVSITAPTAGTWTYTNAKGMNITFEHGVGYLKNTAGAWIAANATSSTGSLNLCATNGATWYITGVQLEVGSVATPFEHRSYGEELALCQRYYATSGSGYQVSVDIQDASFPSTNFPVTMRANPTAIVYAASDGTANAMSRYAGIKCTVSSAAAYPNGIRLIQHDSESDGRVWGYRWTADAEL